MLAPFLTALVDFSRRQAKWVVLTALLLSLAMGAYVIGHIKINTDINQLLSDKLEWRQREKQLEKAFPQKTDNLVIVLDGDNANIADNAADALVDKLTHMTDKFKHVSRPDALPFFRTNGLLFLSKNELSATLDQVAQAQPLMATMISDPSLRGFFGTLGLMVQGAQSGAVDIATISAPLKAINTTVKAALDGQDTPLDWESMLPSQEATSPTLAQTRKYILVKPVLNYADLQPGETATRAIRQAVQALQMTPANGVHVRLTGDVALNDEEFASVAKGAGLATVFSALMVLGLLFAAMRTWRIVAPIAITLCVGLIASTAFATVAVGSLNLISVAFAVMFIGIAVDFGIQFGIRYRDQHHLEPNHAKALSRTAHLIAVPLAMAAGSTALGFLSFIPTDYRGVSELGLIAGAGMVIAFLLNITLLPALMTLTKPPAETETIGYAALAPLNLWLLSHRKTLLPAIVLLTLGGLAIATQIHFDFDPLDLKNPHSESVSTMFDAMQDPNSDAYAAAVLTASQKDAQALSAKLQALPEVNHTMTVESFIPEDQEAKLAMIADTTALLAPTLTMKQLPPPTDDANLRAVRKIAAQLHLAGEKIGAAQELATTLDQLVAQYNYALLQRTQDNIINPLRAKVSEVNSVVHARRLTLDDIPDELKNDWITPDGKWLVEIFPQRNADNNPRDLKVLTRFIDAVQKVVPDVAGTPVSIRESGRTIVKAFIEAGVYGLISIAVLALVMLRRPRDVALMLAPLLVAGILTLATITLIGLPLNFANIIALPLLLSLGVSYAVYFVSYWRSGHDDMLQSSMARAILFSAATVLVAFISLCLSAHPGTRGMGVLLTIALVYSLLCTFLMLPVLLGPHRQDKSS